jgi:hypothetical protein
VGYIIYLAGTRNKSIVQRKLWTPDDAPDPATKWWSPSGSGYGGLPVVPENGRTFTDEAHSGNVYHRLGMPTSGAPSDSKLHRGLSAQIFLMLRVRATGVNAFPGETPPWIALPETILMFITPGPDGSFCGVLGLPMISGANGFQGRPVRFHYTVDCRHGGRSTVQGQRADLLSSNTYSGRAKQYKKPVGRGRWEDGGLSDLSGAQDGGRWRWFRQIYAQRL